LFPAWLLVKEQRLNTTFRINLSPYPEEITPPSTLAVLLSNFESHTVKLAELLDTIKTPPDPTAVLWLNVLFITNIGAGVAGEHATLALL